MRHHSMPGQEITPSIEDVISQMTKDFAMRMREMETKEAALPRQEKTLSDKQTLTRRSKKGEKQFVDGFMSFGDRVRSLESWQDQLPRNAYESAKGKPKGAKHVYTRITSGANRKAHVDVFQRSSSGTRDSSDPAMLQPQAKPDKGGASFNMQNLFRVPSSEKMTSSRNVSRAEHELLLLKTYAPNWQPKQETKQAKQKRPTKGQGHTPDPSGESQWLDENFGRASSMCMFPVNEEEAKGRRRKKKSVRRSASSEALGRPKTAPLPETEDAGLVNITRELSPEQKEDYKQLPRPKTAIKHASNASSRPTSRSGENAGRSNLSREVSSEEPILSCRADSVGTLMNENSRAIAQGHDSGSAVVKLKPKLLQPHISETKSSKSDVGAQEKTFGCPECFHAFGGICVKHLATTWKSSLKQALLDNYDEMTRIQEPKLKVKLFTSAYQESRGKEMLFFVEPHETVHSLKYRIMMEYGTPTMFQRFVYRGHILDDDTKTMAQCGLDNYGTLFVVLEPPSTGLHVQQGCDYCAKSLGGVCTRHLREKRIDMYPKHWREAFTEETEHHRAPREYRGDLNDLKLAVDESLLGHGPTLLQLFRVEMLKRFNSVFDAWIYFDMDGDGSITLKEFEATCRPLKLTEVSPSGVVEVFNQIDAKDKLFKLWPFTFARALIWHESPLDLKVKAEIYRGVDAARVNRREIWRLAHERSTLPTPVFQGINDEPKPATASPRNKSPFSAVRPLSSASQLSVTSSRISSTSNVFSGCPLCEKAINGRCHRCLPVYRNGVQVEVTENSERQVTEVLHIAQDARQNVLTAPSARAFFELDGVECGKGSMVSVLFENDVWHKGYLDAFNPKTLKVRIRFPNPRIGLLHASMMSLQIKVGEIESSVSPSSVENTVVAAVTEQLEVRIPIPDFTNHAGQGTEVDDTGNKSPQGTNAHEGNSRALGIKDESYQPSTQYTDNGSS